MKTIRPAPGPAAVLIVFMGWLLLAPGPGRGAPDGDASGRAAVPGSDAAQFAGELRTRGAVQFYENTEDLVRAGRFERAFLRYAFLKGQIAGQAGYRPLVAMINQRLHFLQGQLRLPAQEFAGLKAPRLRVQPPVKKEETPPAPPPAPPAKVQPDSDDHKGDAKPAGQAIVEPASSPPDRDRAGPPQPPDPQEKSEEVQAEAEKPPEPPSSRWQRLKKRLLFWRK